MIRPKRSNCGRGFDRGATDQTGIGTRADLAAGPLKDRLRRQSGHFRVGIDPEIRAAVDVEAVGLKKCDLAIVDVSDIGREQ